ncbi:hypothetical protein GOEFS_051_00060 [Gordonia effusa NBRC 100432]|uniref:Uncharacterized protein n=1 Tax=Gordonia effusa NBRC 100432 TaxID=1077974 RepID=H0QZR0_9ACTN|nr:hypothetical protein [Gordonia effusa]GAB18311.1 hypothetical protein GOEFS_051_00060 [Gordonia effusa NBRC 100432]
MSTLLEVTAEELLRGDRIVAHREPGRTVRRQWVVKAPLGVHPDAGIPGIQLESGAIDSPGFALNLWPGTDFTSKAIFVIER